MSKLAIAFVLALAATTAHAQDVKSRQSQTPAVADADEDLRPFLFDRRMQDDGARQRTPADDHQPNSGAIIMPPKATQPVRQR